MRPSDIRRTESYFDGADGRRLFRRSWCSAPSPTRVVVIAHGLADHSGRYDRLASWLSREGSAVFASDFVGHGHSSGTRGHIQDYRQLLDDLERCLGAAGSRYPGLPQFLVGQGLGAAVAFASLLVAPSPVRGAVLAGTMLGNCPGGASLRTRLAGRLWPTLRIAHGIDPNALCRDPEVVRRYLEDEWVGSSSSAGMFRECRRLMTLVRGRAPELARPVLLLHGADDQISPFPPAEQFAKDCGPLCELRSYPGARHEVFQEAEAEPVWRDLRAWLRAREG